MIRSSGLPHRTGHRVFPSTALRRHWPVGLSDQETPQHVLGDGPPHPPHGPASPPHAALADDDQATVSLHRRAYDQGRSVLWHVNSLAALVHSALSSYALPKSGLTLGASYVVLPVITSGPVRLPLRPSLRSLYITLSLLSYPPRSLAETVRVSGPTSCFCHRMPPSLLRVPDRCVFPLLHDRLWPSPKT